MVAAWRRCYSERPFVLGQSLVAQRLMEAFPHELMFVPGLGWHHYDGRRWETGNGLADHLVNQAVVRSARLLIGDAAHEPDEGLRKSFLQAGHSTLSNSHSVAGAVSFLRSHPGVVCGVHQLSADPWVFNTTNGTLDLRTGVLRPHDAGDRITRLAGTLYDPQERGQRYPRFLREALANPQLEDAVARAFGGVGLPGVVREHVLPIIFGPGGSGKGTFIETLSAAFGDYAIAAESELLLAGSSSSHPTGMMDLIGIRLAFVNETDEGRLFDAARMKRLTGGDTIRARKMRQDFVEFTPSHMLALITNHLPVMPAGDDPAVWRRVRVIPFDSRPEKPDPQLLERLRDELPAVLAWLVRGLERFTTDGGDVKWPADVLSATRRYRDSSDLLSQFIASELDSAPQSVGIPTGRVYDAWKTWLEGNASDVKPGRVQDFIQKLRDNDEVIADGDGKNSRTRLMGRNLHDYG